MSDNKYSDFVIQVPPPPPNCEVWIADDVIIHCTKRFQWWQRVLLRILLGWKVKHV